MLCLKAEGGSGAANDVANTMMQKFWDSALALEPDEEFDSQRLVDASFVIFFFRSNVMLTCMISSLSEISLVMPSEVGDGRSSIYPAVVGNSFAFKLQDKKGRMHRFTCGGYTLHSLTRASCGGSVPTNNILCFIAAGSESLDELMSSITQRLGTGGEKGPIQLLVSFI